MTDISIKAIICGAAASMLIIIGLPLVFDSAVTRLHYASGALVGGYVAGAMSKRDKIMFALVVGIWVAWSEVLLVLPIEHLFPRGFGGSFGRLFLLAFVMSLLGGVLSTLTKRKSDVTPEKDRGGLGGNDQQLTKNENAAPMAELADEDRQSKTGGGPTDLDLDWLAEDLAARHESNDTPESPTR